MFPELATGPPLCNCTLVALLALQAILQCHGTVCLSETKWESLNCAARAGQVGARLKAPRAAAGSRRLALRRRLGKWGRGLRGKCGEKIIAALRKFVDTRDIHNLDRALPQHLAETDEKAVLRVYPAVSLGVTRILACTGEKV